MGEASMIRPTFMLASVLLLPTVAVAQSLDIGDDSIELLSETEESVMPPDAEDLEGQIGSSDPVIVEPQFDMKAEQPDDLGATTNLNQTEPDPAPGLMIKIPTN
jgi:hypothetical protein